MTAEFHFLHLAHELSRRVYLFIKEYYQAKLISGDAIVEYENKYLNDIKAAHKIDKLVKNLILKQIQAVDDKIAQFSNIFIEGEETFPAANPRYCVFIDPVDGSRSADQHIGDPCIMLAFSPHRHCEKFKHLVSCYIRGLHSGDIYFTYCGKGYFIPNDYKFRLTNEGFVLLNNSIKLKPIKLGQRISPYLSNACVIIRDGYGMRHIVTQKIDHNILNNVKHTFSYDITGAELCYLASGRDIVHVVVEARRHKKGSKWIGSDRFNLIPYPLVKAVGGVIYSLDGKNLHDMSYDPKAIYDFIAASDINLLNEFLKKGVKSSN